MSTQLMRLTFFQILHPVGEGTPKTACHRAEQTWSWLVICQPGLNIIDAHISACSSEKLLPTHAVCDCTLSLETVIISSYFLFADSVTWSFRAPCLFRRTGSDIYRGTSCTPQCPTQGQGWWRSWVWDHKTEISMSHEHPDVIEHSIILDDFIKHEYITSNPDNLTSIY